MGSDVSAQQPNHNQNIQNSQKNKKTDNPAVGSLRTIEKYHKDAHQISNLDYLELKAVHKNNSNGRRNLRQMFQQSSKPKNHRTIDHPVSKNAPVLIQNLAKSNIPDRIINFREQYEEQDLFSPLLVHHHEHDCHIHGQQLIEHNPYETYYEEEFPMVEDGRQRRLRKWRFHHEGNTINHLFDQTKNKNSQTRDNHYPNSANIRHNAKEEVETSLLMKREIRRKEGRFHTLEHHHHQSKTNRHYSTPKKRGNEKEQHLRGFQHKVKEHTSEDNNKEGKDVNHRKSRKIQNKSIIANKNMATQVKDSDKDKKQVQAIESNQPISILSGKHVFPEDDPLLECNEEEKEKNIKVETIHHQNAMATEHNHLIDEAVEQKLFQSKLPRWKIYSLASRAHMKMGLDEHYQPTFDQLQALQSEKYIDIVICPYCRRHFNKHTAKTHFPFCKKHLEEQLEKQRKEKYEALRLKHLSNN